MKLHVSAEINPIKGGVEARVPTLRLAGHGADVRSAVDSLQRGIVAWCRGLEAAGHLHETLVDRGITVEEAISPSAISVEIAITHKADGTTSE